MLTWDDPSERYYQTGVDRGVLYPTPNKQGPLVATNLATNPSGEHLVYGGPYGWGSNNSDRWATENNTTDPIFGDNGFRTRVVDPTTGYSSSTYLLPTPDVDVMGPSVTPGERIYVALSVRASHVARWIPPLEFWINFYKSDRTTFAARGELNPSQGIDLPAGIPTRIYGSCIVPVDAAYATHVITQVLSKDAGMCEVGETVDLDGLVISKTPFGNEFFDGSTNPNPELYSVAWKGTPNQSESTLHYKAPLPVVWNGLTGVDENSNTSSSILYRDGRIYLSDVDPGDFEGSLTAFMWPEEFNVCMGFPEATDGLYVDNQKPKRFHLSYRTLIGSGEAGDMFGYQIHLLYNLMAQPGNRSRKTKTNTPAIMDFSFGLVGTPVKLPGFRPSVHYVLDTRHMDKQTVSQLEAILYGDGDIPGRMPTPSELYDLMNFGSSITFVDHGDGTWTARGAYANVHMTGPDTWEILNVNGTDHGDGTFTLEDTP